MWLIITVWDKLSASLENKDVGWVKSIDYLDSGVDNKCMKHLTQTLQGFGSYSI